MGFDAVVLAAGAGTRFLKSGGTMFKQVVPYKGVPVIKRIVNSLEENPSINRILIVLGEDATCAKAIRDALSKTGVEYRENLESTKDNNLISFEIGTRDLDGGVIVVEADCIFEREDVGNLLRGTAPNEICWANIGLVDEYTNGGTLELGSAGDVEKIHVFDKDQMASFKNGGGRGLKMFGITVFGSSALQDYRSKLALYEAREGKYFHAVATEFPEFFRFKSVRMSDGAFSFNVVEEFGGE